MNMVLVPVMYDNIDTKSGIIRDGSRYGLIDKCGRIVIPVSDDIIRISIFDNDKLQVETYNGKYLVNRNGKRLTELYNYIHWVKGNSYILLINEVEKIVQI